MTDNQLTTIQSEASQLEKEASKFEVTTQLNYDAAANFLKTCMNLKKKIELFFDPTIKKFKEAKKVADEGRKAEIEKMEMFLVPVTASINMVRGKCKDYENAQEKLRIEEQKRLDEKAEKKAEDDRKKIEDQAENEKKWGDNEKAEELKEESKAIEVEEVKAKPVIAKTAGLGIRRTWKWRITDLNKIPRGFLTIDETLINRAVREQKEKTNIPGIEVYED